jgi:hypothetical protein
MHMAQLGMAYPTLTADMVVNAETGLNVLTFNGRIPVFAQQDGQFVCIHIDVSLNNFYPTKAPKVQILLTKALLLKPNCPITFTSSSDGRRATSFIKHAYLQNWDPSNSSLVELVNMLHDDLQKSIIVDSRKSNNYNTMEIESRFERRVYCSIREGDDEDAITQRLSANQLRQEMAMLHKELQNKLSGDCIIMAKLESLHQAYSELSLFRQFPSTQSTTAIVGKRWSHVSFPTKRAGAMFAICCARSSDGSRKKSPIRVLPQPLLMLLRDFLLDT